MAVWFPRYGCDCHSLHKLPKANACPLSLEAPAFSLMHLLPASAGVWLRCAHSWSLHLA